MIEQGIAGTCWAVFGACTEVMEEPCNVLCEEPCEELCNLDSFYPSAIRLSNGEAVNSWCVVTNTQPPA
ncbi:hypothetical protein HSBAA_10800 [Vreelandella sulfidaeris]|uniref:Uncharacterized protein n=1 Tax=Vreelandella sulfidaeris TaxID=115553 RepID=A0A455U8K4_9GAMM|nr:hypothetical protein HSBAA_10800 [Halomonas sulfidaeris]